MLQFIPAESVVLQVPLHRVKLCHRVAYGRSCSEHDPFSPCDLIKISAFHEKVRAFLRFRLGDTAHVPHLRVKEEVLVIMALIDEKPVHSKLFEAYHIVFPAAVTELFEFYPELLFALFHRLYGKPLASVSFQFCDPFRDLIDLSSQHLLLSLHAYGNLLELRMPDYHCIVLPCGDPCTELLPVFRLKILLCRNEYIRCRVKLQKLRCPLLCQVVRHYEHGLAAKAEPFAFHRCSCHLESLSRSDHMCKQSISTIYDAGCCIPLMLSERYLRIHPGKYYVASVIFSWSDRIEFFIVYPCQPFPSFGIFPYPAFEGVFYGFLLSLSDGCLLFI